MAQIMTILVCLDYRDVRWELPIEVAAGLCRCLVAWQANPPPVDGGVPEVVAKVLASALVSRALVTFPTRTRNLGISFVHAK